MSNKLKIVSWYSGGVTSAVATKMLIDKYGVDSVDIVFFETGNHHPDNTRFIKECSEWYGKDIEIFQNEKYKNVWEVLEKGYINSPHGAACTLELKKKMRIKLEKERNWDHQSFGFEYNKREIKRAERFLEQYPDTNPIFPLIDAKLDKKQCFKILKEQGIDVPMMYKLGFHNANCNMCVKGGMGYWNKIRTVFPENFKKMAELERKVGATCLKEKGSDGKSVKLYLDTLDPERGRHDPPLVGECGIICPVEEFD